MDKMVYIVEVTSYDVVNRKEVSDPAVAFNTVEDAREYCNREADSIGKVIEWIDEDFLGFTGDDESYTEYSIRHAKFM